MKSGFPAENRTQPERMSFMKKIIMPVLLCLPLASLPVVADTSAEWYDCSGKADGNYTHPDDCTKFMSCVAQTHAYERNCGACPVDPVSCPTGRLHYDESADACFSADKAGCVTGN